MELVLKIERLFNNIQTLVYISLFLVLSSCGSDKNSEEPETDFDVRGMLVNMADNLIIPAYYNFSDAVNELNTALAVLDTARTTENLESVKQAYLEVHMKWHRAAMYNFGPAVDVVLRNTINTYPANAAKIDENITSGTYNLGLTSAYAETGLNALDYLLYGKTSELPDDATVDYMIAVSAQMKSKISYVISEWNSYYRDSFVGNLGTSEGSSVSLLLNDYSLYTEKNLRTAKVRIPSGFLPTSDTISLNHIEAKYSANYSSAYIQEAINAVSDYYYGIGTAGDGLGIDDYLQALGTDLDGSKLYEAVREQLQKTITDAAGLTNPFSNEVQNNRSKVESVYYNLQDLVVLIKIHITTAIGVKVSYTDTDGD